MTCPTCNGRERIPVAFIAHDLSREVQWIACPDCAKDSHESRSSKIGLFLMFVFALAIGACVALSRCAR